MMPLNALASEMERTPTSKGPLSSSASVNDPRLVTLTLRETQLALAVLLKHHLASVHLPPSRRVVKVATVVPSAKSETATSSNSAASSAKPQPKKFLYAACVDEALLRLRYRSFVCDVARIHKTVAAVVLDMCFKHGTLTYSELVEKSLQSLDIADKSTAVINQCAALDDFARVLHLQRVAAREKRAAKAAAGKNDVADSGDDDDDDDEDEEEEDLDVGEGRRAKVLNAINVLVRDGFVRDCLPCDVDATDRAAALKFFDEDELQKKKKKQEKKKVPVSFRVFSFPLCSCALVVSK